MGHCGNRGGISLMQSANTLSWRGLPDLVWTEAHCVGTGSPHSGISRKAGASLSERVHTRYRDKYREPEVHRLLCGNVFLSGSRPRFGADLHCHACYCRRNCDMLVRSSRACSVARGDCDGVSSREGLDRSCMWRAHYRNGNPAGPSLAGNEENVHETRRAGATGNSLMLT